MGLKTRAILIANLSYPSQRKSDERSKAIQANEDVLNECMIVSSCFNCTHSDWSEDKTTVKCARHNMAPPAWCIACGCQDFDFIPF